MEIITLIDTMAAKLALMSLIFVAIKFITKRIGNQKIDKFAMKVHRPATYVFLVTGITHMITSYSFFQEYGFIPYLLGTICLLSIIGAVLTFKIRKKLHKNWILWHRGFTIIAIITAIIHPFIII